MSDLISRDILISRLDALNVVNRQQMAGYSFWDKGVCRPLRDVLIDNILALPYADRPTGEWEQVPYKIQGHEEVVIDGHSWRCSNCGDARKRNQPDMRFCPNCGAKMEGDTE